MMKSAIGTILSRQKNCLIFDGVNIVEFTKMHKTPMYIFSEREISNKYDRLRAAFTSTSWGKEKFKLAYSIKNNFIPIVIDVIRKKGGWFEVTSEEEMRLLRRLGVSLSRCIYTNIWKSTASIRYAIRNGMGFFAIDSLSDMRRICAVSMELNQKVRVLIRVNPAIDMRDAVFASAVPWSKTGVEIVREQNKMKKGEDAATLVKRCLSESNLILSGIHGHLGSQIVDIDYYDDFSKKICDFYLYVKNRFGVKLDTIDFGGGYPIDYGNSIPVPSIENIAKTMVSNLKSAGIDANLIVESGRYITGNAGILVTKIVCIKNSPTPGKIIVTDASAYNELLDSVLVHWFFDMTIANKMDEPMKDTARVVGGTTDSIDVFDPLKENVCPKCQEVIEKRRCRFLQRAEEGDILVILGAGAYTTCFNNNYCLRPRPAIYLIRHNGNIIKARREEKLANILACYTMPKVCESK